MTQTTGGIGMALSSFEVSTDFSNWTDMSGFASKLARSGGERKSGEYYTAGTDIPGLTTGPRSPIEVIVDIVYTEGGAGAWKTARTAFLTAAAILYFRYSPKGGQSTEYMFTSEDDNTIITECPEPVGDFGSGDPVFVQLKFMTAEIDQSAVA